MKMWPISPRGNSPKNEDPDVRFNADWSLTSRLWPIYFRSRGRAERVASIQYTESLAMHSREKQNVRMARPTRVDLPGGWYHVLNRGIEKRAIFRSARC